MNTRSVKVNAPKVGRGFEMTLRYDNVLDLVDDRSEARRDKLAENDYVVKMQSVGRKLLKAGKTDEQALTACERYRYGAKGTAEVITISEKQVEEQGFSAENIAFLKAAGISI